MKKSLKLFVLLIAFLIFLGGAVFATDEKELKLGDLDDNGIVNATDYAKVVRYLKGYENLTEAQLKAADVDKNGTVNATDYAKVVRYLKGYEELEEEIAIYVSSTGDDETADGTKDKPYKTLAKAFDISNSGKTIKLLSDIELAETCILNEGEFVLDLNGFKIYEKRSNSTQFPYGTCNMMFNLNQSAKLTIRGNKEGSKIENVDSSDIFAVFGTSSLIINGGEYIDNTSNKISFHSEVIRLRDNPSLEINDGYFKSDNWAINVEGIDENKIVLNGGEFAGGIALCDWGFGTHTQIRKCLGKDKVAFDVENNDYAQIKKINYGISYEIIDAQHVKIIDKGDLNLNSFNTVRIVDLRDSEIADSFDVYEPEEDIIETYNNYVRLRKPEDDNGNLLGYSFNQDRLNSDYKYNDTFKITIDNLNNIVNAEKEITLYEVWKRHNVIFDLNGGTLQGEDKLDGANIVMTGEYIKLPTVKPVKENYVFSGWAVDKNDIYGKKEKMSYGGYSPDTDDLTIYAVWLPEWFANAQKEKDGNGNKYTMNVVGQKELDELVNMIPYIKQFNDEGIAKYVFNVQNAVGATEDLKINKDITLNSYVTVKFNSNIVLNSNIEVKNGISCSFGLNKITEEGKRSKVGFTGTGSIILSGCYECYIGTTLAFGTSKSAGMYGGTIVLSKDQETDELIVKVKSGTATIKNYDFGLNPNVIDFVNFTVDYKLIVDEGAKLVVDKKTGVTGELINNGTIQINNGYSLTIKEDGTYTQGENAVVTGDFIQE